MFFKLKISKADKLFSKCVRERAAWCCERCYLDCISDKGYLDCSHFHSRAKKSVRFDLDNAAALCKACHHYFTDPLHKHDHEMFFLKRLGLNRLNMLEIRANTPQNVDEKMMEIYLKAKLIEFEKEHESIGARK
jgi:hypothetical protein